MMHYPGETIGNRTLVFQVDKDPRGNKRWLWRHECGEIGGPSTIFSLNRALEYCTSCQHDSEEWRHKQRIAQTGRSHSWETRARMSASHKNLVRTPEHCVNISKAKKQQHVLNPIKVPTEALEAARQANIGNKFAVGHQNTPESRRRTSERLKKMWAEGRFEGESRPYFGRSAGAHAGVKMRCLNSEGVFARDCEASGITWVYEPRRFKLSWCTYTPDFYLPEFDIWIEVKGHPGQVGNWAEKMSTFRRETGKTLILVFQKELSSQKYTGGE